MHPMPAWSYWQTRYVNVLMPQYDAAMTSFGGMGKHLCLVCGQAIDVLVVWLDCYISLLRRPEMRKYDTPTPSPPTTLRHSTSAKIDNKSPTTATSSIPKWSSKTVSTMRYK
jgi:hypothetical protein